MIDNSSKEENSKLNNLFTGTWKAKLLHISFVIFCTLLYMVLNYIIVRMSSSKVENYVLFQSITVNKYTLNGIIAQGQVVAVIMITVSPVKKSNRIALSLCTFTGISALLTVLVAKNMDAMPGIIVAITSSGICLVITYYGRNLNNQIQRVLEYSRIVKKNEEMLHQLAYYDTLTGLPNRKMIMDQIELMTDPDQQDKSSFKLVYMDVDNFKKINDSMGHSVGDIVLRQVAQRWKKHCHEADIIGRVGGDEFVILIRHNTNQSELIEYLNSFRSALKKAIIINRKEFHISVSLGVTCYPSDGRSADELFRNADIALYKAKNYGKDDFLFFNKDMQEEVIKRIHMENALLSAVKNHELYMVYQPQYYSSTGKLRGYEALVRWKHPEWGLISPSEFIPVAEETGIIIDIGKWIIETVLSKFMLIKDKYKIKAVVSINISVAQVLEPSFVSMVKDILYRTGFDSRCLEFEITESLFISYPDYVIQVIRQLKELGIRIALDDFGTGYASLHYLQMLPINILKIDKTFIDKINMDKSMNKMVGGIISLSHRLGIKVVAEGVETKEQYDFLNKHQCDYIQGYLLGRPQEEQQLIDSISLSHAG